MIHNLLICGKIKKKIALLDEDEMQSMMPNIIKVTNTLGHAPEITSTSPSNKYLPLSN